MNTCIQCSKALNYNEIGATKKFLNRGTTNFYCLDCLADKLDIPLSLIEEKIEQFKSQGCTLFV